jgi:hypothetical protein
MNESDPERVLGVAQALAHALDAEDYTTARRMIDTDAVYVLEERVIEGAEAIIASYAEAGTFVRRTFEEFRYESAVEVLADGRASVLYTDYLARPPARWHRHRTRQLLTIGAGGLVVRIENEDLPGEREALQAYLAETGTTA